MITGIGINDVEAHRPVSDPITNMKFNINFDNVKVTGDNVEVTYTFSTEYEGGEKSNKAVGNLVIKGSVFAKEDKETVQQISSTWKDKKTLPIRFAEDVINILNFECASRGTLLAWSIGMLAPLPLTRAKLEEGPEKR
ncbi:MAG: hypothetical protein ABSD68_02290 [Candidatus Micrarchaeales archaeon]|jgi:hypothetical protein